MALGALAPLLLLGDELLHHDAADVLVALALLACFAASGALGGLVHGATVRMRARGYTGTSWAIVGSVTALTTMLGARLVTRVGTIPMMQADRIAVVTGVPAMVRLVLVAALVGALWARTALKPERTPLMVGLSDEVGGVWLLTVLGIAAIGSFGFLFESKRTPLPETPEEARKILASVEREARARPRDAQSQFTLALSLMHVGRLDDAIPAFQRTIQLAPDNAWAHSALGWSLNRRRKFAEAIPHEEEALRLDPRYVDALFNLGEANLGLRHYQAAEVALREAARLDPHRGYVAAEYANALSERGKLSLAVQYILRASRLEPDVVRYHGLAGMLLRDQHRFAEASAQFREVIRLDQKSFLAWMDLGITQYLAGDASGAAASFNEGKRLDPQKFEEHQMARQMLRDAEQGHTDGVRVRLRAESAPPDSSRTAIP